MKRLEKLFKEHELSLSEIGSHFYSRMAAEALESLISRRIPEPVLLKLNHPEYIPTLTRQINGDSCGPNSLNTVLKLEYGIVLSEKILWYFNNLKKMPPIKNRGSGPKGIAALMHLFEKDILGIPSKVFMTTQGSLEHLDYLLEQKHLPIMHRFLHEDNSGGHYETVIGLDNRFVYMHDPARYNQISGIHKMEHERFMEYWWPLGKNRERWFLVMIQGNESLPDFFKGKYM